MAPLSVSHEWHVCSVCTSAAAGKEEYIVTTMQLAQQAAQSCGGTSLGWRRPTNLIMAPCEASEQLLQQEAERSGKRASRCVPSTAQMHAFANLLKTMIGSGLLTLPWATSRFGLLLSLIGLLYLAYLSQAAIRLTVRCVAFSPIQRKTLVDELRHTGSLRGSHRQTADSELERGHEAPAPRSQRTSVVTDGHGAGSWQIISTTAFGEPARVFTIALLTLAQAGASVSYFDFVAATMGTYLGTPRAANVVSLWAVLCVLSLLKQLRSVAWLSAAGLLTYLFVLGLLLDFGAKALAAHGDATPAPALARPAGLGAWFGPALFAFEGMGTALSIYEAMELADPRPYFAVVSTTYVISYALYAAVGAFGYWAWGEGVERIVLDSFPAYNTSAGASHSVDADLTMAAHLALSVVLALSFVLQMTPVYHVVEDLLHGRDNGRLPARCWPLTRAAIVALVALVGALVPDMETMISLTGSVAFSAIGFVLPGVFFLRLQPAAEPLGEAPPYHQWESLALSAPGAAGGVGGGGGVGGRGGCSGRRLRYWWDQAVAVLLIVTGVVGGALGVASNL